MPRLIRTCGIDSSVFLRLLTGHPEEDFSRTVDALQRLNKQNGVIDLVVSNHVIGESYVVLQHFYSISKSGARKGIKELFKTGSVRPLNGQPVLDILSSTGGAGLVDRLIAQEYQAHGNVVLTNDKQMAKLEGVERLY